MSAPHSGAATALVKAGEATRFKPGQAAVNPGGLTKAERRFRRAVARRYLPEATRVLDEMLATSRDPEVNQDTRQKCRMDFMKCIGAIPKQTDAAAIQEAAKAMLTGMIEAAREQRQVRSGSEADSTASAGRTSALITDSEKSR